MTAPMHVPRKGPQRVRVVVDTPATYPPGYFTEPVRAWTQLAFKPSIVIDSKTKRFATEFAMQAAHRKNSGFDGHPLNLPGAIETTNRLLGRLTKGQVS